MYHSMGTEHLMVYPCDRSQAFANGSLLHGAISQEGSMSCVGVDFPQRGSTSNSAPLMAPHQIPDVHHVMSAPPESQNRSALPHELPVQSELSKVPSHKRKRGASSCGDPPWQGATSDSWLQRALQRMMKTVTTCTTPRPSSVACARAYSSFTTQHSSFLKNCNAIEQATREGALSICDALVAQSTEPPPLPEQYFPGGLRPILDNATELLPEALQGLMLGSDPCIYRLICLGESKIESNVAWDWTFHSIQEREYLVRRGVMTQDNVKSLLSAVVQSAYETRKLYMELLRAVVSGTVETTTDADGLPAYVVSASQICTCEDRHRLRFLALVKVVFHVQKNGQLVWQCVKCVRLPESQYLALVPKESDEPPFASWGQRVTASLLGSNIPML